MALQRRHAAQRADRAEPFKKWSLTSAAIIPNAYRVDVTTTDGGDVSIYEDQTGVFLAEDGDTTQIEGTAARVRLPSFQGHRYSEILKVLHQEILINIVDSRPVPNSFVYHKPWRRDAAMMAMCLQHTGNLELIRDWVLGLDDPYDHNNGQKQGKPENETDNLDQTLYLLSLFTDKNHPLVQKILDELPRYEVRDEHGFYIKGRSDLGSFHPLRVACQKFLYLNELELRLASFSHPCLHFDSSCCFIGSRRGTERRKLPIEWRP